MWQQKKAKQDQRQNSDESRIGQLETINVGGSVFAVKVGQKFGAIDMKRLLSRGLMTCTCLSAFLFRVGDDAAYLGVDRANRSSEQERLLAATEATEQKVGGTAEIWLRSFAYKWIQSHRIKKGLMSNYEPGK